MSNQQSSINPEIARCKRKITILKNRNQAGSDEYLYWSNRLTECEHVRFDELIAELEAEHGPVTLEKKIIADGSIQVTVYGQNGEYIRHLSQKIIPDDVLEFLPIGIDFRDNNPVCEVCGQPGTQLHHWAPKHLFPDAEQWPQSYLCNYHHNLWHNTILFHRRNGHGQRQQFEQLA